MFSETVHHSFGGTHDFCKQSDLWCSANLPDQNCYFGSSTASLMHVSANDFAISIARPILHILLQTYVGVPTSVHFKHWTGHYSFPLLWLFYLLSLLSLDNFHDNISSFHQGPMGPQGHGGHQGHTSGWLGSSLPSVSSITRVTAIKSSNGILAQHFWCVLRR